MDRLTQIPGNMCTVKAGATAGTTTTYTTANSVVGCIGGKAISKAAATNAATPTTDVNTGEAFEAVGVSKGSVFVLGYNAAGTIKVAQGSIEDLDAAGSFKKAPEFPGIPDDFLPFAYLVTKVGSTGSAWTFGSSNLAGPPTGVTHTFVDIMTLPARPQVS